MRGDNFADGFGKTRPALADVTNRKRAFSSVMGDLGLKSVDGYGKKVDGEDGNSQFAKKVCLGVENLIKEKCETVLAVDSEKDTRHTHSEVGISRENVASASAALPDECKTSGLFDGSVHTVKDDAVLQSVVEAGDASRDSCASSILLPACSGSCKKDHCGAGGKCEDGEGHSSGVIQSKMASEGFVTRVGKENENDIGVGKLALNKYGSTEWPRLSKSQSSKFPDLERCTGVKGDVCANLNAGANIPKGCSCSFCLKAGYIWLDLHYQDVKGRIAVLKKTQKETSILAQQSCRGKDINVDGQGNSNKLSKLESDLTGHWRSLFLHMGDMLVLERNHLQSNFVALKDLRENCKTDLDMHNGMATEKH
ncbi:uncharacterized protein LOC122306740 isoform X1 [Carya illinoinensis]|uniref:Uncharacterized protein n=1 Tax=Carya illinoinensis TaxID=32201 RepID=A0A8T1QSQ9_CARIL|nr:uncharacterized protein LOC122306740 isoform X1 [Carya illinoinensis]KAG6657536.1 hypothetical protein CIPAW_04G097600 [Carya illinoinensis]